MCWQEQGCSEVGREHGLLPRAGRCLCDCPGLGGAQLLQ